LTPITGNYLGKQKQPENCILLGVELGYLRNKLPEITAISKSPHSAFFFEKKKKRKKKAISSTIKT